MSLSPHVEYRNGFPYQAVNDLQQYVSLPEEPQLRYSRYFSLDARVSKDINVSSKHAVRLSLNGINLSNHANYLQVHNNTEIHNTAYSLETMEGIYWQISTFFFS